MKTIKFIKSINNFLKKLIGIQDYFENYVKMSNLKFGEMRRQYSNNGFAFSKSIGSFDDCIEIYRVYPGKDKFGDDTTFFDELALYDVEGEELYFKLELKKYFDAKYFIEDN